MLYDEITTIDHALTRPWTVTRRYRREPQADLARGSFATKNNHHVEIGRKAISSATTAF